MSANAAVQLVTEHPDDVAQIRLPMAGNPMRYVNAYVFREDDGLTLVDCGWRADDVFAALEAGLAALGATLADVRRLAVTHAHFDHYGLAGTLRRAGVPTLYLHAADARFAESLLRDQAATDRLADAWLERNGLRIEGPLDDEVHYTRTELTPPTHLLADGARVGRLRALHTPGHTPGHLCFVDERGGRMLTGDHVLARVSPHVGVWFPDAGDPLDAYVTSLRRVRDVGARGALPAHGEPFDDLAGRVDELLRHHDEREAQILGALGDRPMSAAAVAGALGWTRRATPFAALEPAMRQFAVAETIAHLVHLRTQGRVRCDDAANPIRYARASRV